MERRFNLIPLGALGLSLCFATLAMAQQPAAEAPTSAAAPAAAAPTTTPAAPTAAAPAAAASNTNNEPSAGLLKKAHQSGYYTRTRKGQTFFCKKAAQLGTRFETENCISQEQLAMTLEREQAQRDQLRNITCGGGSSCGGGK